MRNIHVDLTKKNRQRKSKCIRTVKVMLITYVKFTVGMLILEDRIINFKN